MVVIPAGASAELLELLRANTGATVTVISVAGPPVTGVLDSVSGNLAKVNPTGAPPVYFNISYIVRVAIEATS